jgi:antitoxin component of RelBE/YafQ-DinJ toxin-antitoxin module
MGKQEGSINGRLPPLLRAVANRLNTMGIPDAEIIRRGIRKVAEEEGMRIEWRSESENTSKEQTKTTTQESEA